MPGMIKHIEFKTEYGKIEFNRVAQEPHNAEDEVAKELARSGKTVPLDRVRLNRLERWVRQNKGKHAFADGFIESGIISLT